MSSSVTPSGHLDSDDVQPRMRFTYVRRPKAKAPFVVESALSDVCDGAEDGSRLTAEQLTKFAKHAAKERTEQLYDRLAPQLQSKFHTDFTDDVYEAAIDAEILKERFDDAEVGPATEMVSFASLKETLSDGSPGTRKEQVVETKLAVDYFICVNNELVTDEDLHEYDRTSAGSVCLEAQQQWQIENTAGRNSKAAQQNSEYNLTKSRTVHSLLLHCRPPAAGSDQRRTRLWTWGKKRVRLVDDQKSFSRVIRQWNEGKEQRHLRKLKEILRDEIIPGSWSKRISKRREAARAMWELSINRAYHHLFTRSVLEGLENIIKAGPGITISVPGRGLERLRKLSLQLMQKRSKPAKQRTDKHRQKKVYRSPTPSKTKAKQKQNATDGVIGGPATQQVGKWLEQLNAGEDAGGLKKKGSSTPKPDSRAILSAAATLWHLLAQPKPTPQHPQVPWGNNPALQRLYGSCVCSLVHTVCTFSYSYRTLKVLAGALSAAAAYTELRIHLRSPLGIGAILKASSTPQGAELLLQSSEWQITTPKGENRSGASASHDPASTQSQDCNTILHELANGEALSGVFLGMLRYKDPKVAISGASIMRRLARNASTRAALVRSSLGTDTNSEDHSCYKELMRTLRIFYEQLVRAEDKMATESPNEGISTLSTEPFLESESDGDSDSESEDFSRSSRRRRQRKMGDVASRTTRGTISSLLELIDQTLVAVHGTVTAASSVHAATTHSRVDPSTSQISCWTLGLDVDSPDIELMLVLAKVGECHSQDSTVHSALGVISILCHCLPVAEWVYARSDVLFSLCHWLEYPVRQHRNGSRDEQRVQEHTSVGVVAVDIVLALLQVAKFRMHAPSVWSRKTVRKSSVDKVPDRGAESTTTLTTSAESASSDVPAPILHALHLPHDDVDMLLLPGPLRGQTSNVRAYIKHHRSQSAPYAYFEVLSYGGGCISIRPPGLKGDAELYLERLATDPKYGFKHGYTDEDAAKNRKSLADTLVDVLKNYWTSVDQRSSHPYHSHLLHHLSSALLVLLESEFGSTVWVRPLHTSIIGQLLREQDFTLVAKAALLLYNVAIRPSQRSKLCHDQPAPHGISASDCVRLVVGWLATSAVYTCGDLVDASRNPTCMRMRGQNVSLNECLQAQEYLCALVWALAYDKLYKVELIRVGAMRVLQDVICSQTHTCSDHKEEFDMNVNEQKSNQIARLHDVAGHTDETDGHMDGIYRDVNQDRISQKHVYGTHSKLAEVSHRHPWWGLEQQKDWARQGRQHTPAVRRRAVVSASQKPSKMVVEDGRQGTDASMSAAELRRERIKLFALSSLWILCSGRSRSDENSNPNPAGKPKAVSEDVDGSVLPKRLVLQADLIQLLLSLSADSRESLELRFRAIKFCQTLFDDKILQKDKRVGDTLFANHMRTGEGSLEAACVLLLGSDRLVPQAYAASMIARMTLHIPRKRRSVAELGGIECLIGICEWCVRTLNQYSELASRFERTSHSSTTAIWPSAEIDRDKAARLDQSAERHLVVRVLGNCLKALLNLSTDTDNQVRICKIGLHLIVNLSELPQVDLGQSSQDLASRLLLNLSRHPDNKHRMYREELHLKRYLVHKKHAIPDKAGNNNTQYRFKSVCHSDTASSRTDKSNHDQQNENQMHRSLHMYSDRKRNQIHYISTTVISNAVQRALDQAHDDDTVTVAAMQPQHVSVKAAVRKQIERLQEKSEAWAKDQARRELWRQMTGTAWQAQEYCRKRGKEGNERWHPKPEHVSHLAYCKRANGKKARGVVQDDFGFDVGDDAVLGNDMVGVWEGLDYQRWQAGEADDDHPFSQPVHKNPTMKCCHFKHIPGSRVANKLRMGLYDVHGRDLVGVSNNQKAAASVPERPQKPKPRKQRKRPAPGKQRKRRSLTCDYFEPLLSQKSRPKSQPGTARQISRKDTEDHSKSEDQRKFEQVHYYLHVVLHQEDELVPLQSPPEDALPPSSSMFTFVRLPPEPTPPSDEDPSFRQDTAAAVSTRAMDVALLPRCHAKVFGGKSTAARACGETVTAANSTTNCPHNGPAHIRSDFDGQHLPSKPKHSSLHDFHVKNTGSHDQWAMVPDDPIHFAVVHCPPTALPPALQPKELAGASEEDEDMNALGIKAWHKSGSLQISNILPLLVTPQTPHSTIIWKYRVDGSVPEIHVPLVGGIFPTSADKSKLYAGQVLSWKADADGIIQPHELYLDHYDSNITLAAVAVREGMQPSKMVVQKLQNVYEKPFDLLQSIFAPRKQDCDAEAFLDTPQVFEKSAQCDWDRVLGKSQVQDLLRGAWSSGETCTTESQQRMIEALQETMAGCHLYINGIFRFYCAYADGDAKGFALKLNAFTNFIRDCQIEDEKAGLDLAAIDTLFITTNLGSQNRRGKKGAASSHGKANMRGRKRKIEDRDKHALVRYEFCEMLLRLAFRKYLPKYIPSGKQLSKDPNSVAAEERPARVLKDLMEHIRVQFSQVEGANAMGDPNTFRSERLYCKAVDGIARKHQSYLRGLFNQYGCTGPCGVTMELRKWMKMMQQAGFFSKHPWLVDFSRHKAKHAFLQAKMQVIDELGTGGKQAVIRAQHIFWIDFLEAIARTAYSKHLPTRKEMVDQGCNCVHEPEENMQQFLFVTKTMADITPLDKDAGFMRKRSLRERLDTLVWMLMAQLSKQSKSSRKNQRT